MRRVTDIILILALVAAGVLVWLGQQHPPDRYLEDIRARGSLRVGIDPTYPPFEFIRDGQVVGYDVELARAIAADLGVAVEMRALALDTLYDALEAGNVDMLVSALPFVYERQKEVRYSVPYYQAGQVVVVQPGSSIRSAAALDGRAVGVELGSNADTEARRLARTTMPRMEVRSTYHSGEEALDGLARGEVEAAITDNTTAQAYIAAHLGAVEVLSPPLTDEPYVAAMPAQAMGLAAQVDATIERLRASGELARMMSGAGR
ncbi:MAG TPA: ABC transporter substrate-binding protein [Chloroflexia bacterium]|nr:ABC transporter substrate-binding protein [Chloroflexia bacterium]